MTGTPPRTHGDRVFKVQEPMPELPTLAQTFRDAGYQAYAVGKLHVYPQRGKRSGAYMQGFAYDVHPYLLLNHNDDYESLSTFAHEWGHAMHTLYAKQAQPFETREDNAIAGRIAASRLNNKSLLHWGELMQPVNAE